MSYPSIDATDDIILCAACGKKEDEDNNLKACTACKMVKYCNRDCQIAHRRQHKKACKKRSTELKEEALFKQPPPNEDCPVCFLPLPPIGEQQYQSCCGKMLCCGCMDAVDDRTPSNKISLCPFCRTPSCTSDEEIIERVQKRVERNDAKAISMLAGCYADAYHGVARDINRAMELWTRASDLGSIGASGLLGDAYNPHMKRTIVGVEKDLNTTFYYYEMAAKGGHDIARLNLGLLQCNFGNFSTGMKHLMIAAAQGHDYALQRVKEGYMEGHVTKDDFAKALRAHKDAQDEIQSEQRTKAKQERERG